MPYDNESLPVDEFFDDFVDFSEPEEPMEIPSIGEIMAAQEETALLSDLEMEELAAEEAADAAEFEDEDKPIDRENRDRFDEEMPEPDPNEEPDYYFDDDGDFRYSEE